MSIVLAHHFAEKLAALRAQVADLQRLVDEQAEDECLWFVDGTAAEAYVQQALRRLHAAVEAVSATTEGT